MKPITLSKFVVGISVALVASALAAGEITLFEREGFQGRRLTIRETMWNLDRTDFNDRAASLSVLGGYWMFCSDANFEGSCRTFGPGDYPNLPSDLDHRISSGRRIADRYPYEGRPTWQR